jgi:ankyrin repeat protein
MSTSSVPDLFTAIDGGDAEGVAAALAADPRTASSRDIEGVSATMHALYRGQRATAEQLAAALPELDVFEAAALARAGRVRELVAAEPALSRARSADGFTALHYPAFFGGTEAAAAAEALIAAGADVNARSDNGLAVLPIHSAVAGGHDEVVAVLIDAGADVNATQRHGWTPLHGAAQNGSLASVERLLAAGADPAARNDDGVDALALARQAGHEAIVARLS